MKLLAQMILWVLAAPFLICVVVVHGDEVAESVHDELNTLISSLVE